MSYIFKSVFIICSLCVCAQATYGDWYHERLGVMGTELSIRVWHENADAAKQNIDMVIDEMRRIDKLLSPYKPNSELSLLNSRAATQIVQLSYELNLLIQSALYYSDLTQGAFDITFASLGQYYDYREHQQPSQDQFDQQLEAINYKWLAYDSKAQTLRFTHPQVKIDLGGIAKGWAVDRVITLLERNSIQHASVSLGGDSKILGDRQGRPWIIGIKHPRSKNKEEVVIRLPIEQGAVSTSGDYERYFIDEARGERVHHILNPVSGRSTQGVMSVTVLGAKGLHTDPLSTAVFVLGVEKGLKLINTLDEFEAILIDEHGKVHYSQGLEAG